MEQGRYEEAVVALDISIDIEPTRGAYFNNGVALSNLERYEEAVAAYNQAIVMNSTDVEAYVNKGNALSNLERYEEAIAALDRALVIVPLINLHILSKDWLYRIWIGCLKHSRNITRL